MTVRFLFTTCSPLSVYPPGVSACPSLSPYMHRIPEEPGWMPAEPIFDRSGNLKSVRSRDGGGACAQTGGDSPPVIEKYPPLNSWKGSASEAAWEQCRILRIRPRAGGSAVTTVFPSLSRRDGGWTWWICREGTGSFSRNRRGTGRNRSRRSSFLSSRPLLPGRGEPPPE